MYNRKYLTDFDLVPKSSTRKMVFWEDGVIKALCFEILFAKVLFSKFNLIKILNTIAIISL